MADYNQPGRVSSFLPQTRGCIQSGKQLWRQVWTTSSGNWLGSAWYPEWPPVNGKKRFLPETPRPVKMALSDRLAETQGKHLARSRCLHGLPLTQKPETLSQMDGFRRVAWELESMKTNRTLSCIIFIWKNDTSHSSDNPLYILIPEVLPEVPTLPISRSNRREAG